MEVELKYRDALYQSQELTTQWQDVSDPARMSLSSVGQGVGATERRGRKYRIHSIEVQGMIFGQPLQDLPPRSAFDNTVNIALVLNKKTNRTATDPAEVFLTWDVQDPLNGQLGLGFLTMPNLEYSEKFQILSRVTKRCLNYGSTITDVGEGYSVGNYAIPFYLKYTWPEGLDVTSGGVTNTVQNIVDNNISLLATCSKDSLLRLEVSSRIRFTDRQ